MSTYKQGLAVSKLVGNGGNVGKAMVDAGYSPATAKTPKKLTKSKGFSRLMEEYFPDEMLAEVHRDLLTATKSFRAFGELAIEPDYISRAKSLDMAYKLKGYYKGKEETATEVKVVVVNFASQANAPIV